MSSRVALTALFLVVVGWGHPVKAVDIQAAMTETAEDIRQAAAELTHLRDTISAERSELGEQVAAAESRVRELRTAYEQMQAASRQTQADYEAMQAALAIARQEADLMQAIATEMRRSLEARVTPAEQQLLRPRLDAVDALLQHPTASHRPGIISNLLAITLQTQQQAGEGYRFNGECAGADGIVKRGTFFVAGPLAYFSHGAESLRTAGLIRPAALGILPHLHPARDETTAAAITDMVNGGTASVPVDVSGGQALSALAQTPSLATRIRNGGLTMIPLAIVALLALLLSVLKFRQLANTTSQAPERITTIAQALRRGDLQAARAQVNTLGEPLGPILAAGVRHAGASREDIEELMHEQMLGVLPSLDRHLGFLAVLGGVAPLLGLLGTVTGMIHTFELVQAFGAGNPRRLSGGISEALITTLAGLIIAVPVLLVHAFLARRVKTITAGLEQSIAGFVNHLSMPQGVDAYREP